MTKTKDIVYYLTNRTELKTYDYIAEAAKDYRSCRLSAIINSDALKNDRENLMNTVLSEVAALKDNKEVILKFKILDINGDAEEKAKKEMKQIIDFVNKVYKDIDIYIDKLFKDTECIYSQNIELFKRNRFKGAISVSIDL